LSDPVESDFSELESADESEPESLDDESPSFDEDVLLLLL
jgi:hypothetical protein